jgi:hypothetical protein
MTVHKLMLRVNVTDTNIRNFMTVVFVKFICFSMVVIRSQFNWLVRMNERCYRILFVVLFCLYATQSIMYDCSID